MRSFNQWMNEYGVSHQDPTNQLIHKICVPLIMLSVVGLIWSMPIPEKFETIPYLNWATIFVTGCLFFYMTLNFVMFVGMLILTSGIREMNTALFIAPLHPSACLPKDANAVPPQA